MNELYWITRLDSINNIFIACVVVSAIIVGVAAFVWLFTANLESDKKDNILASNILKRFIPVLVISSLLFVFTPTTKDALMIYGIGSTIDYIKSNDTAKKLPDKCIQALDKFVDEYILDTDNTKENAKD